MSASKLRELCSAVLKTFLFEHRSAMWGYYMSRGAEKSKVCKPAV
jgi:hypothetical protein